MPKEETEAIDELCMGLNEIKIRYKKCVSSLVIVALSA